MIYKIIMVLAALYGLFRWIATAHPLARIILSLMIVGIAFILPKHSVLNDLGVYVYLVALFLTIIYVAIRNKFGALEKFVVGISAILLLLYHVFEIQLYPGTFVLGILMIIPILAFIYLLRKPTKYYTEWGIFAIMGVNATVRLFQFIEWATQ